MKAYKIFLIIIIFGISYIWSGDAYSHQGETHKKHIDESIETHAEPQKTEENTLAAPMPEPSQHEGHIHPQKVETGAFNLIRFGSKRGYIVAVVFTGFIAVIWGMFSLFQRGDIDD